MTRATFILALCLGGLYPAAASAGASASKLANVCYNALSDSDGVLAYVRKLMAAGDYATAESCLQRALSQVTEDRDLAFALAHVIAAQGRPDAAEEFIKPWLENDAGSLELIGDLRSQQGNTLLAAKIFRAARARTEVGSQERLLLTQKYLRAVLQAQDAKEAWVALNTFKQEKVVLPPALAAALHRLSAGSSTYLHSLSPWRPSPLAAEGTSVAAAGELSDQSQGQSLRQASLVATYMLPSWLLGVAVHGAERVAPGLKEDDSTLDLVAAHHWANFGGTALTLGSTPGAQFSYSRLVAIQQEFPLTTALDAGAALQWANYPAGTSLVGTLYSGFSSGRWRSSLQLSQAFDGYADLAFLAREQAKMTIATTELSGEVFAAGGRGDPESPYLNEPQHAPFRQLGLKLGATFSKHVQPYALIAWRAEQAFFERRLSFGVSALF